MPQNSDLSQSLLTCVACRVAFLLQVRIVLLAQVRRHSAGRTSITYDYSIYL